MKKERRPFSPEDRLGIFQEGECAVYVRHPNGGGYWTGKIYSVAEAQSLYNDPIIYSDYSYVSGYCCASC